MEHTMAEWPKYKEFNPWTLKDAIDENLFKKCWPTPMQNCDSMMNEVDQWIGN